MVEDVEVALAVEVRVQVAHVDHGRDDLRVTQDFQRLVSDASLVRKPGAAVRVVLVQDGGVDVRGLKKGVILH